WKIRTYKITYNLNGGSSGQTGSLSVTYNGTLPTISKSRPTRSGYTFKGWYDNTDYTKGKQYYNENNVAVRNYDKTSNLTLYAGWSKVVVVQTYQVTFNINGGVGTTPGRVNAVLGSAMPSIIANVPTRSGYTFMGWYDNANYTKGTQYYTNKNASARLYDKLNGITLYAGWKENIYTISFNANNGSGGQSASIKVKPNETLPSISKTKPTRSGYTFMGWYDNKDYTKATQYYKADCTPTKTYQVNKNLSLYAGWKESSYASVNYSNFKWTYYKKRTGPAASYNSNINSYAIWAPENINDLNGVSLPLIVWLHGSEETMDKANERAFLKSGLLKVMTDWNTYNLDPVPAIIVAPQSTGWWATGTANSDSIRALIRYATDYYKIDTNKIVFMGHSMGGYGVVEVSWGMKDIQFYSIVIMSARKSNYMGKDGQEFYSKQKLRGYGESQDMGAFLSWANQSNNYTYYKGVDHGKIPQKAMTDDTNGDKVSDLMTWLFGEDAKIK
ncbi:MAG: InlB B-repeat-containing protein, partial [Bacilli bacterium]|nr:InlB B-repeat-containing protein [Bacilli bacterium]